MSLTDVRFQYFLGGYKIFWAFHSKLWTLFSAVSSVRSSSSQTEYVTHRLYVAWQAKPSSYNILLWVHSNNWRNSLIWIITGGQSEDIYFIILKTPGGNYALDWKIQGLTWGFHVNITFSVLMLMWRERFTEQINCLCCVADPERMLHKLPMSRTIQKHTLSWVTVAGTYPWKRMRFEVLSHS